MELIVAPRDQSWRETLRARREKRKDVGNPAYPTHPGCNPWVWNVRPRIVNKRFTVAPGNQKLGTWDDGTSKYAIIPGTMVFMPRAYAATLADVPPRTLNWVAEAITRLGWGDDPYNLGLNHLEEAGRTLPWPHVWIINRRLLAPPAYKGKGFALVLAEAPLSEPGGPKPTICAF